MNHKTKVRFFRKETYFLCEVFDCYREMSVLDSMGNFRDHDFMSVVFLKQ